MNVSVGTHHCGTHAGQSVPGRFPGYIYADEGETTTSGKRSLAQDSFLWPDASVVVGVEQNTANAAFISAST